MADTANMGLYDLNDMDLIPDDKLVSYFCNETNMAEIFQYKKNDILDKLELRDANIVLDIRRSLLHKIASLYKDFHTNKAKKRQKGSQLAIKDIHALGYCILYNTTYSLGTVYSYKPDTVVTTRTTRKTSRGAPAHEPAPGHAIASTSTSAPAPISVPVSTPVLASETINAIAPLLAAARVLASAPSLAPAPASISVPAPAPASAPATASLPATSPSPAFLPTPEITPAPVQGHVSNMRQTIVSPQIQHLLDKMNIEIVQMKHQQALLKDSNTQKIHISQS